MENFFIVEDLKLEAIKIKLFKDSKIIQVPFFISLFLIIGFIFTIAYKTPSDFDFIKFWIENTITALCVGSFSAVFGYFTYTRLHSCSLKKILVMGVSISILGGILGRMLSLFLHHILQDRIIILNLPLIISSISSLMITLVVSSFSLTLWYLQDHEKIKYIPETKDANENVQKFIYKKDGKTFLISCDEIVYLTANGKKTILHTKNSDIEIRELMKDVLIRLPEDKFIRVHKKYSININYAGSIEHLSSGDYQVFLWKENFIVPVSYKNQKELKQKLSIK